MSNRFKFRAYHTKRKEWCFGYEKLGGFSLFGEVTIGCGFDVPILELKHLNIMQSTGLKDKNGVEIFEGDWVTAFIETPPSYSNPDDNIHLIQGRVFFDVGCFLFGNGNYLDGDHIWDLEIIGNIHENPELLEREQARA